MNSTARTVRAASPNVYAWFTSLCTAVDAGEAEGPRLLVHGQRDLHLPNSESLTGREAIMAATAAPDGTSLAWPCVTVM